MDCEQVTMGTQLGHCPLGAAGLLAWMPPCWLLLLLLFGRGRFGRLLFGRPGRDGRPPGTTK